jgi:Flp pilus assembly protein TadB
MKENLSDREKLEIEKYVDERIKKNPPGTYETISSFINSLAGLGLLITGIILLFVYWIIGLIMIILGIIFLSSVNKNQEKIKQLKKDKKEKMIKEIQLKALKGEKWKTQK